MTKPEITFYQADETIARAIAPLLLKILEEKKKALIFCKDSARIKEIDASLWSYGRHKFIPHATIFDKEFAAIDVPLARHPIVISDQEKNPNEADYLIFLDEASEGFLKSFSRVFYFFENANLTTAKALAGKLQPKTSYKKEDGKWVKMGL